MTEMEAEKRARKAKTTGSTKVGIGEKVLSNGEWERDYSLENPFLLC